MRISLLLIMTETHMPSLQHKHGGPKKKCFDLGPMREFADPKEPPEPEQKTADEGKANMALGEDDGDDKGHKDSSYIIVLLLVLLVVVVVVAATAAAVGIIIIVLNGTAAKSARVRWLQIMAAWCNYSAQKALQSTPSHFFKKKFFSVARKKSVFYISNRKIEKTAAAPDTFVGSAAETRGTVAGEIVCVSPRFFGFCRAHSNSMCLHVPSYQQSERCEI